MPGGLSGGSSTNLLAAALLAAVYAAVIVRQISGRGPQVWQTFAVGGGATVAFGVLDISGAEASLWSAFPVLVFLFALFVFATALETAGVLDHVARWLVSRARTARELPVVLFIGFGLLSSLLVNDALVLLGVPLLFAVSRRHGIPVRPLLLTLAFAVTVGSALTPLGNPQNLLVSLSSGMSAPVSTFLRYLLLPTLLNLVLGAVFLKWAFGPVLGSALPQVDRGFPLIPSGHWARRIGAAPVLVVFPATMLTIVALDLTSEILGRAIVPIYVVAVAGAAIVLLASRTRARVLRRVDLSILVLFAGLFLVVDGAVAGGIVGAIEGHLSIPAAGVGPSALIPIVLMSLAGPQLVSNVPWVALQIPIFQHLGYGAGTPVAWIALAAGSTLAGNLTLLGAASNLIVVQESERAGVRLTLGEFVRWGIPLTALTIPILVACLYVGL